MTIEQLFQDKTIKAKGKVSTIGEWLTNNEMPIEGKPPTDSIL